jgi:peptide/nickel transport system substrate-binding protein
MMMHRRQHPALSVCFFTWLLLILPGCPPPDEGGEGGAPSGDPSGTTGEAEEQEVLLEPFDAPPLDELEAQVEWEEMPVRNAYDLYKEHLAQSEPPVSVEEALELRNDSPEANETIISTLGRPPASDAEVGWDRGMTRAIPSDIKSSNPLMISSTAEFEVLGLTGFGLFSFDWNFEPFAMEEYVESWQASKDRLYDKVVMRDDIVWSDDEPITAHDIAFSFQTIMNPKIPIPAVRAGTDQIRWVEAYDDRTVVFFHKQPLATNIWNVNFPIIPQHIYKDSIADDVTMQQSDYHLKYERNPVCGGPYKIVRRREKQEILLERREEWFERDGQQIRRKPFFKTIRFRILSDPNTALLALKKGEIDDWQLSPEQWQTQTDDDQFYQRNTKVYGAEWSFAYFGWNTKTPFFEDSRVRWAMSYAFDHEEMLKNICYGLYEPCRGIYHETAWMAPDPMPEALQQDLDKAESLLDEAGWTDTDGDGYRDKMIGNRKIKFEFTILFNSSSPTGPQICELLKSNLDQIGVQCNVKPTEFTVLQEKSRKHEFHAMLAAWGTGTDPSTGENLWTTGAGRNFVQYSSPKVDDLFKQGESEFDRDKRAGIYGQIATQLWEDQPYTWLFNTSGFFGFNRDVRGYMFSPRGPYTYGPGFDAIWKPAE